MPQASAYRAVGPEIDALTGLRGFAALWVLLYHAWVLAVPKRIEVPMMGYTLDLTPFFSIGWSGVQIFFVLSGFLLARPYVDWLQGRRERPRPMAYLARRCARVLPAYYVQLGILLILSLALYGGLRAPTLHEVVGYASMLFVPPPIGVTPLNGVWWTLPIEFSFYLLLPAIAGFLIGRRVALLLIIGGLVMVTWRFGVVTILSDVSPGQRLLLAYQLPGALDSFVIGMVTAYLVDATRAIDWLRRNALQAHMLALVSVGVGILTLYWMHFGYRAYWTLHPLTFLWTPVFSLTAASVVVLAASAYRPFVIFFANRFALYLGTVSYGIYLWHHPILDWLASTEAFAAIEGYALSWLLSICLVVTIILAGISWSLVERPAIAATRGFLYRRGGGDGK